MKWGVRVWGWCESCGQAESCMIDSMDQEVVQVELQVAAGRGYVTRRRWRKWSVHTLRIKKIWESNMKWFVENADKPWWELKWRVKGGVTEAEKAHDWIWAILAAVVDVFHGSLKLEDEKCDGKADDWVWIMFCWHILSFYESLSLSCLAGASVYSWLRLYKLFRSRVSEDNLISFAKLLLNATVVINIILLPSFN